MALGTEVVDFIRLAEPYYGIEAVLVIEVTVMSMDFKLKVVNSGFLMFWS